MRLAVVACVLAGCQFHHGELGGIDAPGGGGDDASDARPVDSTDACVSFSTHLDTCMPMAEPGGPLVLSGTNKFDTDTKTLTTPAGTVNVTTQVITTTDGDITVLLVSSFSMSGTLRVAGDAAFGIVSYDTVALDGTIDLTDQGAGARSDEACNALGLKGKRGVDDTGGGSGGGGGAFAGNGGDGSDGDNDGGASAGAAGGVALTTRPTHIAGGCDGGGGGNGDNNGGSGGHGGGAIFIAAATSISVNTNGAINVGGGGGKGGTRNDGGGAGGGSGGMIVLESGTVTVHGKLAANGGGGGEGADSADDGDFGDTGTLSTSRAAGGSGNAGEGADGAGGGANTNAAGQNATQFKHGGGGGGGGGVGFIAIGPATPTVTGSVISPPYAAWP